MYVIETNIDDCSGEALGFLMECLLEEGAADVWYTPAVMKRAVRPTSSTLSAAGRRLRTWKADLLPHNYHGIRRYPVERTVLNRRVEEMDLPLGKLAVKVCSFRGEERFYPEYESIARISRETGLGFAEVYHLPDPRRKRPLESMNTETRRQERHMDFTANQNKKQQLQEKENSWRL